MCIFDDYVGLRYQILKYSQIYESIGGRRCDARDIVSLLFL